VTIMTEPGIGIVGLGGFGVFCLAAFADMAEITVAAAADSDPHRAAIAEEFGARAYTRYEDLLADPGVQIVAINTPPYLHAPMAIQAARAGKHLFVEKPLATSLYDARTVIQAARDAGVSLTVDYVLRFHPLHQLAARVVHSGALGPLRHFSLENFATDDILLPGHWFWDPAQSGGIHVEHGVHFFDACNQLAGRPADSASGTAQMRADSRTDRVSATVRYGDDILATFYHSFDQIGRIEQTTIRITCTRGHLALSGWIPTELTLSGMVDSAGLAALQDLLQEDLNITDRFSGTRAIFAHGGVSETLAAAVQGRVYAPDRQDDYKRAIQAGVRNLVAAVREDAPLTVTPDDGLSSLAVALAATESSQTGQSVALRF
jgi:predicted dehydrogenase